MLYHRSLPPKADFSQVTVYSPPQLPYSPQGDNRRNVGRKRGKRWHPARAREKFPLGAILDLIWLLRQASSQVDPGQRKLTVISQPKFSPKKQVMKAWDYFFISSWIDSFKKGPTMVLFLCDNSYSSPPLWDPLPLPGPVRLAAGQPGSWSS